MCSFSTNAILARIARVVLVSTGRMLTGIESLRSA